MSILSKTLSGAAVLAALAIINRVTSPGDERQYYRKLKTPPYAPPAWTFGAVWSGLNALQIWADQKLIADRRTPARAALFGLRGVNWALYNLFSPAFFNLKSPRAGAAVSWSQLANTLVTIALARRNAPYMARALLPTAAWLGFAAVLGNRIAVDNPDAVLSMAARTASPAKRSSRRRTTRRKLVATPAAR
jgi:benzodiazapine receptor